MKNTFGGLINKLETAEKKSVLLKKYQQKLPKLKYKEKMNERDKNDIQELWTKYKGITYA